MRKVSKINFLFAVIVSAYTLLSLISMIVTFFFMGIIPGIVFGIIAGTGEGVWIFLDIGLPIMLSMMITSISLIPALLPALALLIVGILGLTKLGTKKGLNIAQLVIAGLALVNGASLPAVLLIEGAAFGLAAAAEEKQLQQEVEAEQVQEEALEELSEKM